MDKSRGTRYSEEFKKGAIKLVLENKQSIAEGMPKSWVTDISYIGTDEGWLYLATVKDLFDRQIVGFATELCKRALASAIHRYKSTKGITHHSDRGVQYASKDYQKMLRHNGMICSMSRTGMPYDNACAETFFSTIKLEMIYH